jgi:hypothetical protein
MAAFFALKYAYLRPILRGTAPADNLHRIPFYILSSLLMLTILHGASILKILVILSVNYALAKVTGGTRFAVPIMWIFNAAVLFANEWYGGYAFATLHPQFAFLVCPVPVSPAAALTISIGSLAWCISPLAPQLQHHHVTPCLLQRRLPLGM